MNDVIVEPIRRIREELINRYGGIDGYFKHCQAQGQVRITRRRPSRRNRATKTVRSSKI